MWYREIFECIFKCYFYGGFYFVWGYECIELFLRIFIVVKLGYIDIIKVWVDYI